MELQCSQPRCFHAPALGGGREGGGVQKEKRRTLNIQTAVRLFRTLQLQLPLRVYGHLPLRRHNTTFIGMAPTSGQTRGTGRSRCTAGSPRLRNTRNVKPVIDGQVE